VSTRSAAACGEVSPPRHRRDRQGSSLNRADPAGRGKPACVHENVRFAMTVGDLQGDVFIEGSTLDRFPTITYMRRLHCTFPNLADPLSLGVAVYRVEDCDAVGPANKRLAIEREGFGRQLRRSRTDCGIAV
jgi:hypothetical protein